LDISFTKDYSKNKVTVFIDDLKDVHFLDESPSRLVMESEKRTLLLSLVESHLNQMIEDQVPPIQRRPGILDREKGLTLLLHGGPGTGKTFAATFVAELVKCPLLSDTIGIRDSSSVERKLSKLFQLAQRWLAILVLENADAFLTQRSRNEAGFSAVTLAIRSMDSYTGILILTTSRVGDLDEAVWSYTDLAINFPPLRGERLQKVWGHSISEYKVKYYSRIMDFIEDICKTEGLEVNGRDIRNITLAAQNLAKHQHKFLEVQHIQAVLENRKEFMKYIKDLSGSDMAGRAMQMQIRNDTEPEKGKAP
jgi:SpoVK/Ycf46/Vps4 family AAA+-type ATPase